MALATRHQQFFWGKSSPQIYCQPLHATSAKDAPDISVAFSINHTDNALCLSYGIKHRAWLDFNESSTMLTACDVRQDYLWEQNCLECFFDFGDAGYIEMNFSPKGVFNLYQFSRYRTPDALPPQRADGHLQMACPTDDAHACHIYHLKILLKQDISQLHKIHPCVILYHDGQPIFYAHQHASPPDFHDKTFWLDLANV